MRFQLNRVFQSLTQHPRRQLLWYSKVETTPTLKTSYQITKSGSEMQVTVHKASILTLKRLKQLLNPAKFKVSSIKVEVLV